MGRPARRDAGGRQIVREGRHTTIDVAAELRDSIATVLPGAAPPMAAPAARGVGA